MLAARRARGGRCIVLMKPSLPIRWFDLCLVPEHDGLQSNDHVMVTRGVLNKISAGSDKQSDLGLMLIGGPSAHHHWQDEAIYQQISTIMSRTPTVAWQLTTSRRTPDSFLTGLPQSDNLVITPWQACDPDWLPRQLARAAWAWISEDSVSMIYEGLTAGCACGILEVPRRSTDRVIQAIDRLSAEGLVTTYAQWNSGALLKAPAEPLDEADRCAGEIFSRWQTLHAH